MSNCKNILIVYEKYMKSGTELTLTSDLLQLIRLESSIQITQKNTKCKKILQDKVIEWQEEPQCQYQSKFQAETFKNYLPFLTGLDSISIKQLTIYL